MCPDQACHRPPDRGGAKGHGYHPEEAEVLSVPLADEGTVRGIIDGFKAGTITSPALED